MSTPREIYAQYKIMPQLQLHQLRAAAVAKMVCDTCSHPIDTNSTVLACLFHDMGNIIKFNLTFFPQFTEVEGLSYWESVQKDFQARYGDVSHDANVAIGRELSLPEAVVALIDGIGFSHLDAIASDGSYEQKICEYADLRVAPLGIRSLQERLSDARSRYVAEGAPSSAHRSTRSVGATNERFDELLRAGMLIERQIFALCTIGPSDINDTHAAPIVEELWDYPVS